MHGKPPSRGQLVSRIREAPGPSDDTSTFAAALARELGGDEPRTQYLLACYEAKRGRPQQALDDLEAALRRDWSSIEWARRDPLLEPLRSAEPAAFRTVIRWARAGRTAQLAGPAPLLYLDKGANRRE
jgi:hypothetical protein